MEKRAWQESFKLTPIEPEETIFRHGCWKAKRAKVRAILLACCVGVRQLEAWDCCGSDCTVEWSDEGKCYRLRANYCHNRHCEPCMRAKANTIAANLRNKLEERPDGRYRFITLTLRHCDAPLADQIARLYASFKKLRATKIWKRSQRGGCHMLEIKWSAKTRQWHPHLHIISEGGYVAQKDLSAAWHDATGDSHIVDIRSLDSGKDAAHYVSKYVTKGTSNDVWDDRDAAMEWITATKGVRCCATFGTWRGFALTKVASKYTDWKRVGRLEEIAARARAGSIADIYLLLGIKGELKTDGEQVEGPKKARDR